MKNVNYFILWSSVLSAFTLEMSVDILTLSEGETVIFLSSSEEDLSSQLIEEFSRKVGSSGKVTALPINSVASGKYITTKFYGK